jgi:cleavage stimulation factor subunit 2
LIAYSYLLTASTGFCEYYDVDTAASAVRNLNGVAEVRGRLLRVDFAQPDIKDMPKDQRGARDKFGLPPLPPGVILPPGVNPAEQVHNKLSNIPPEQLLDILHQMKVGRCGHYTYMPRLD